MQLNMFITCDDRTVNYALKCQHYHRALATKSESLNFHALCINESTKSTIDKLDDNGFFVHVIRNKIGRGSEQHAVALNYALSMLCPDQGPRVVTANIICDADTAALMRGWDDVIRQLHETYDCVGIQNPDDVVRHNVRTPLQTWLGKPVPQWVSFKNGLTDWRLLDSMPDKLDERTPLPSKQELSEIYGLNYDDRRLLKDTMWKLPKFLHERQLKSYVFDGPFWHASSESKVFHGRKNLNTEDEFQFNGVPILTHGRCCRKDDKDPFWDAVEAYVSKL